MLIKVGARNKPKIEIILSRSLKLGDEVEVDFCSYKKAFPLSLNRIDCICKVCGKEKSVAIQQIKEDGTWECSSCATRAKQKEATVTKNNNYKQTLINVAANLNCELKFNEKNLQNSRLIKACEVCGKLHSRTYSSWRQLYQDSKWICGACANKEIAAREGQTEKLSRAHKGKPAALSEEGRKRKSEATKRMWDTKKEEISQKIREGTSKYLRECKPHRLRYNLRSIPYLKKLEEHLGEKCHYAEAEGGEFRIKGYFLDFYAPKSGLWIEWDEPYHKYYKERDELRTSIILKELPPNTRLIRIDQEEVFQKGIKDLSVFI